VQTLVLTLRARVHVETPKSSTKPDQSAH
jgi:hypothetical protein